MTEEIAALIGMAKAELANLKGYEKADIALRLANTLLITEGAKPKAASRKSLENKPAPAEEKKEEKTLTDLNPQAPIADKILKNINKEPETPAAPAPVVEEKAEPAPAPAKPQVNIGSDEWKKKILTSEELDDEWTPAMMANEDMVKHLNWLAGFCKQGMEKKLITLDWLNTKVKEASENRFSTIKEANTPKFIKILNGHLMKAFQDEIRPKLGNQAA